MRLELMWFLETALMFKELQRLFSYRNIRTRIHNIIKIKDNWQNLEIVEIAQGGNILYRWSHWSIDVQRDYLAVFQPYSGMNTFY